MKKMYLSFLTVLVISGLATSQAKADVYKGDVYPVLRNNYSADVEYIERGRDAENYTKNMSYRVKTLAKGREVKLTSFPFNELSIRTIGGRFHDVSSIRTQINNEESQHAIEAPVITINRSSNPYYALYWNLTLSWERR